MNFDSAGYPGWHFVFGPVLLVGAALLGLWARRLQLREEARSHRERTLARERGSHEARLQHPDIDLAKCIGCGSCVNACPEDGVLGLLHGQAVVVHGARCVGHGLCAAACPTGAIALTLGDLSQRHDLPAHSAELEAVGTPGLFLAGEITGFALVRTAVAHGVAVADAVAARVRARSDAQVPVTVGGEPIAEPSPVLDLLVVGAGPGGLACSLRSKELGLEFVTLEQEPRIGGTVASYPRRKMVMTQPVELPLYGRLPELTYQKEELVEIWESVAAANSLPIRTGIRLLDLKKDGDGAFIASTSEGEFRARNVCLALGRRGSPRRLGVPGENLPKVAYSLLDAESYHDRRILIVGGGDSAIEAALGLAEQPGNTVTLSYRKAAFVRLKAKNEARIQKAIHDGRVSAAMESQVAEITDGEVTLKVASGRSQVLPNDDVFIFAGGDPPFALLERAGVSFDPKDRPEPPEVLEQGTGLLRALTLVFLCALTLMAWAVWLRSYYGIEPVARAASSLHTLLRPAGPVGLSFGLLACALFLWNLTYLLRRSRRWGSWLPGTLRVWMGSHVFTGLMALLCVLIHSGFSMRPTVGGHAMLALLIVVATGSVGRYLYAFIPRAANGTEAGLDDLRFQLASISTEWDRDGRGFGSRVREQIDHLIAEGRWRPGLLSRIWALFVGQFRLRSCFRGLRRTGRLDGIPDREIRHVLMLARKAYRLTVLVAHYDEIRAVLSSWRYFHRWLGLLLVLLAILHIVIAARYATLDLHFVWPSAGGGP